MKKHHKYSSLGFQALKRATALAIEEAQMHNYKVPYWKNGKISVEVPELVSEQNAGDRPQTKNVTVQTRKDN